MSAPSKPWEHERANSYPRMLNSSAPMSHTLTTPVGRLRTGTPPLPPRPASSSYGNSGSYGAANSYNMGYNTSSYGGRQFGYSPYSNYGSMGGYGGYGGMYGGSLGGSYGGMYGNSGYGPGAESRFIQMAEESTRPAFQGIESLVRAFGSISMMLDSTFFAVTSSFRAVLGVAENFGRIRTMFGQIWSSFALFRLINWMYRKVLGLLGVKVTEDVGKQAWSQAVQEASGEAVQSPSSWPIFMFLGMIVSAPYLISKLLPPLIDKQDPKNWGSPGKKVRVHYPFRASTPQELSIQQGEEILIAPKSVQDEMQLTSTGWVLATSSRGTGIIPVNYLQPAGPLRRTESIPQPTAARPAPPMEPVIFEEAFSEKTPEEGPTSQEKSEN